jgi:hypothetical protein
MSRRRAPTLLGSLALLSCLALFGSVAFALGGCAPAAEEGLPPGVEVSVHQNRPDTEDRRLQVRITNGTETPFTVTSLAFSSLDFAAPAPYPKAPSTVRAGGVLDLPVALPEPVCGTADGDPKVELRFEHGPGHAGTAAVIPDDRLQQLDDINERDCLGSAIAAVATISEPDAIRIEPVVGRLVAFVDLAIAPTGASGTFTVHRVDDTVLFGLFDPASATPVESLPLELTVDADDPPTTLTIPLVPGRCDAHATAEDKRGTLLPLRVEVGEFSGIHYFALSDDRKGELYTYLGQACPRFGR